MTILLVEHDMKLVMEACETITVLDYGKKIAEGTAMAVGKDPVVVEAFVHLTTVESLTSPLS